MSSQEKQKILFLGATGYIGGTILEKFLAYTSTRADEVQITAFVRDPKKAVELELKAPRVKTVVGNNSELTKLRELAEAADVVFSVGESTNVEAVRATLEGAKARFDNFNKATIAFNNKAVAEGTAIGAQSPGPPPRPTTYIHTSGAGAIAEYVHGEPPTKNDPTKDDTPTWNDLDMETMAKIEPHQLHRNVDLELLEADADNEHYVKSYIILPTTVYGVPTGRFAEIQKTQGGLLPILIDASLKRGQGGMVGKGQNVWMNVEVNELADLYIKLYDKIFDDKIAEDDKPDHGREGGLYFAENGEHKLYDISAVIAKTLSGKKDSIPTEFTVEEEAKLGPLGMAELIGSNAMCTASRARKLLGWVPKKTTSDLLVSAAEVTKYFLRKMHEAP
ncbi:hypothetical protein C8R44DRAFT_655675 [Mycena epipterygia]|nr:hypothetical protein C8R44DRAFT_655675 [Mycena epipterygia]